MNTVLDFGAVRELFTTTRRIAILSHRNPDGDAIGASLALCQYFQGEGHDAIVILPSDSPGIYGFLKGINDVVTYDRQKERAMQVIKEAEAIFLLDLNAIDRIDEMGPAVMESTAPKLLIDHHLEPEHFADWALSDSSASSTSELIYTFLNDLGATDRITRDIAEALFTGIITDTGSFKFGTNPNVFRICAALKEIGVDDYRLQNLIFNSLTEKQLKLIGHCLANRLEFLTEYRTGIIHLTQEDFRDFGISRGDTEGIVNYILMVRNMRIAAFITDQGSVIKLSFRSKGNISVQELAREYFGGGGHRNASGGSSKKTLQEVLKEFKNILPVYLEKHGLIEPS